MNSLKSWMLLLFFVVVIFSCKQDNKSTQSEDSQKIESTDITDSKEFETYFLLFFGLSDENTKTDLPYVNKYMSDNKLFPFNNICDLLDKELVKADQRVFDFWKKRCEFSKAKDKLMRKYQIDGDSIKVLMEKTIKDGKYNKKIK